MIYYYAGVLAAFFALALFLALARNRRTDLFHPLVLIYANAMLFFLLPSLLFRYYRSPYAYVGIEPDFGLWPTILLLVLGSVICTTAGYYLPFGQQVGKSLPRLGGAYLRNRFRTLVFAYTTIGLAAYLWLITKAGGFAYFLTHLSTVRATLFRHGGVGYLGLLTNLMVCANLLWWYVARISRAPSRSSLRIHTLLVIAVQLTLGGRSVIMNFTITWLALRHYLAKRVRLNVAILVSVLCIIFSHAYVTYRTSLPSELKDNMFNRARAVDSLLGEFSSRFVIVERIVGSVPKRLDYQYGRTYYNVPLFLIPRKLFPNKPDPAADIVSKKLFPEFGFLGEGYPSLPPSLVGEAYLNLGVVGVLFASLGFGVVARLAYAWGKEGGAKDARVLMYALSTPMLFAIGSGDFTIAANYVAKYLVPSLAALSIVRVRRRSGGRLATSVHSRTPSGRPEFVRHYAVTRLGEQCIG